MSLLKESDSEDCGTDEDWIKAQDKGGLTYVKETTYSLFLSIEVELRECLPALTGLELSNTDVMIRDEPILLFSHLFFFLAILLFSAYFSQYFA